VAGDDRHRAVPHRTTGTDSQAVPGLWHHRRVAALLWPSQLSGLSEPHHHAVARATTGQALAVMVTFTLPAGLRPLAAAQPKAVYSALFAAASETLKGFGARQMGAELGQCAVLHTHNRRLDCHPHVHGVVPGGGIDVRRRQFKNSRGVICSTPLHWRGCFGLACWPHWIGPGCRSPWACRRSGWWIVAMSVAASRRCSVPVTLSVSGRDPRAGLTGL
jgi:hypothetical protein